MFSRISFRTSSKLFPSFRRCFADSVHFAADTTRFSDIGITYAPLCSALTKLKFRVPTKVQEQAIPRVLTGLDLVIAAETGCGKTLAYLLPLVQRFLSGKLISGQKWPSVIVLCPSRELCNQILNVLIQIFKTMGNVSIMPRVIFGIEKFPAPFHKVTDILITTPTAFEENQSQELYGGCHHLVLDEADCLLAEATARTTKRILETFVKGYDKKQNKLEHRCQFLFVGATIPTKGKSVDAYIHEKFPDAEWLRGSFLHRHKPNLEQTWIEAPCEPWELAKLGPWRFFGEKEEQAGGALLPPPPLNHKTSPPVVGALITPVAEQRLKMLGEVIGDDKNRRTLIFCSNFVSCEQVAKYLTEHRRTHLVLHGRTPANLREQALEKFAKGEVKIIVCTNVATRGLDLAVDHVIQYDFAENVVDHLHRIGRTGRLAREESDAPQEARVTNFYTVINRALVNAIRDKGQKSLDSSFSRNRNFRHKYKKMMKQTAQAKAQEDAVEQEKAEQQAIEDQEQQEIAKLTRLATREKLLTRRSVESEQRKIRRQELKEKRAARRASET